MAESIRGVAISIDAREVTNKLDRFYANMSTQRADKMLKWITTNTGRKVKGILRKDVPHQYMAKPARIGKDTQRPRSVGTGCIIPLRGTKMTVGGSVKAKGGVPGWAALKYAGKGYPIKAYILKGKTSILPKVMQSMGGQPPFRNTSAGKLHGAVFTRLGKSRLPIAPVKALATPQMPGNRSEAEVRSDIEQILLEQAEKYFYKYVVPT